LRIISGTYKGRKIVAPSRLPVRPTTDQAKEAIFNIINNHFYFEDLKVLDLFAGTGNISYEFCSRGAKEVMAIEINHKCCDFIKKTVDFLKMGNLKCVQTNVFSFLKSSSGSYDLIFADPPYDMEGVDIIPELVFSKSLLNKEGWLVIEHSVTIDFSGSPNFFEQRKYGKVNFSIFRVE